MKRLLALIIAISMIFVSCDPGNKIIWPDEDTGSGGSGGGGDEGGGGSVSFNFDISIQVPYHSGGVEGFLAYALVPKDKLADYKTDYATGTTFTTPTSTVTTAANFGGRMNINNKIDYSGGANYTASIKMSTLYLEKMGTKTTLKRGAGFSDMDPASTNFSTWKLADADISAATALRDGGVGTEFYVVWSIVSKLGDGTTVITNLNLSDDVLNAYYLYKVSA
ncbi:hypothetical protein PVA45_01420 [Entomospira entomophila]|uniref:Lipoprotein n=1 Tax=Entomospira entomophila TaxID=2719988 RepID=A0A968G7T4_9SPIO|nr:hypothetical protein [Entomospira entomophilus]NIZ40175.1 hypothetical protein [Entomospira entomophilus]WDI35734.1 hypothetical protein PVA45_01420 [Entomospira entomophilus]